MPFLTPARRRPFNRSGMKRLSLCAAAAVLVLACGGSARALRPDTCRVIGFIDDNTFRIEADGRAPAGHFSPDERRRIARESAANAARRKALEIFSAGMIQGRDDRGVSAERIVTIVGRGEVVSEQCDDGGRCSVLLEVRAKNLKLMTGY